MKNLRVVFRIFDKLSDDDGKCVHHVVMLAACTKADQLFTRIGSMKPFWAMLSVS